MPRFASGSSSRLSSPNLTIIVVVALVVVLAIVAVVYHRPMDADIDSSGVQVRLPPAANPTPAPEGRAFASDSMSR